MGRLIPAFLILIFGAACNSATPPAGVLPKGEMVDLITDFQLIDGYIAGLPQDSAGKVGANLYLAAFEKHNTDSAHFNKSLKYYSTRPKQLSDIYADVQTRVDTLQKVEERRQRVETEKAEKEISRTEKQRQDSIKKTDGKLNRDSVLRKHPVLPLIES